jgi:hypothetical protein
MYEEIGAPRGNLHYVFKKSRPSITRGMGLTGNRTHDLEVTGADVNFAHRFYHCLTLTAQWYFRLAKPPIVKNNGYGHFENDQIMKARATEIFGLTVFRIARISSQVR